MGSKLRIRIEDETKWTFWSHAVWNQHQFLMHCIFLFTLRLNWISIHMSITGPEMYGSSDCWNTKELQQMEMTIIVDFETRTVQVSWKSQWTALYFTDGCSVCSEMLSSLPNSLQFFIPADLKSSFSPLCKPCHPRAFSICKLKGGMKHYASIMSFQNKTSLVANTWKISSFNALNTLLQVWRIGFLNHSEEVY